jgi:hypothetical protein
MSSMNGDKSRYNRVRKQRIARRQSDRQLLKNTSSQPKSPSANSTQTKTTSA